jgi:hypothetical protein
VTEGPAERSRRRSGGAGLRDWPLAAATLSGWLRQKASSSGIDGVLAGAILVVVQQSAHLLTEVGSELERATSAPATPARKPRRKPAGSTRPRVRKTKLSD